MKVSQQQKQTLILSISLAAALVGSYLAYRAISGGSKKKSSKKLDDDDDFIGTPDSKKSSLSSSTIKSKSLGGGGNDITPIVSNRNATTTSSSGKSSTSKSTTTDAAEKTLHNKIEELDKKGKTLFKNKEYLEAAQCFTDALDLIEKETSSSESSQPSSSLQKQIITLYNNRSAMYEKGNVPELALDDCNKILLNLDIKHSKARIRKLRILENNLKDYKSCLIEVCAIQLQFLQENRDKLRLGLPVGTPPVPQTKLEELMQYILPDEINKQFNDIKSKQQQTTSDSSGSGNEKRSLPSSHNIIQLLKSFSNYNTWMSAAAKDGSIINITKDIEKIEHDTSDTTSLANKIAKRATLLFKRGRRYAYELNFNKCVDDFELSYEIITDHVHETDDDEKLVKDIQDILIKDGTYIQILEWVGMVRHWYYDLKGALKCYEQCCELDPTSPIMIVKKAGIQMDDGKQDDAIKLFDDALKLDPNSTDVLLHRGNLYMLQQKIIDAKNDLERCIILRPDHLLAQLRLATVCMACNDINGAKKALEAAETLDPNSSEVHSYRGEMYFAQGEFKDAAVEFQKAMKCEPNNPTPYVNSALAIMNTPPTTPGQTMPDVNEAIRLLEKSIDIDPQFQPAYVHLGQLKLSMATNLDVAKDVVKLYDKGISYCRSKEELKDIVSMRILTLAQIDAASLLKMETLNMQ